MIERGEKTEEYREMTPYWINRLRDKDFTCSDSKRWLYGCHVMCWYLFHCGIAEFDAVTFSCGYTRRRMTFECRKIVVGQGRPAWGAPLYETFIIKLGERIENIKKEIQ